MVDVEIESPAEGVIDPDAALTFTVVGDDALTPVLTATVTLADGTQIVAFDYDQLVNGFTGEVETIDGGRRITIRRPIGWPFGPLVLTVHAVDSEDLEDSDTRTWDVDTDAASRTIIQYREAPKLNKLIRLHQHIFATLTEVAQQINELDDQYEATGVNLDVTADLVGQPRLRANGDVPSDAELRVLIAARISRNNARVATADYLEALVTLFDAAVRITLDSGMALSYVVMREPTADEIAVLDEDIVARPMGVKVSRSWAPSDYFGFAADPDALGFEQGHFPEGF